MGKKLKPVVNYREYMSVQATDTDNPDTLVEMSKKDFIKSLERKYLRSRFIFSGKYKGLLTPIKVKCRKCKCTNEVVPNRILNHKDPCPSCKRIPVEDTLSLKTCKALRSLYLRSFLDLQTTSYKSGYTVELLRHISIKYKWPVAKHKPSAESRLRDLSSGSNCITYKLYKDQASRISKFMYKQYKDILNPSDIRSNVYNMFSVENGYKGFGKGPIDLRFICHPANLIIDSPDTLISKDVLLTRIREFEKLYGKAEFPNRVFKYGLPTSLKVKKLKVLGFDPGPVNFGCFAGILEGNNNVSKVTPLETSMLKFPITELTNSSLDNIDGFVQEMRTFIDQYKPDAIVMERFMSRGHKGKTIELVCTMIGVVMSLCYKSYEDGKPIYMITPTAAAWKNRVNRIIDLKTLYKVFKRYDITDHQVDAALMMMYVFPTSDNENPYEFLGDKAKRTSFIKSIINVYNKSVNLL